MYKSSARVMKAEGNSMSSISNTEVNRKSQSAPRATTTRNFAVADC